MNLGSNTAVRLAMQVASEQDALAKRLPELIGSEVAKQVAPLADALRQVKDSQRGAANATRGQIESLYKGLAEVGEQMKSLATSVESAMQDANAAKVDSSTVLQIVQDVQERLTAQRQSVVQFLEALNK